MLNPFDLKAALTAKHAQHVVMIHFPIALFIAGAAFVAALYILLAAGTRLLPERLQITSYNFGCEPFLHFGGSCS